MTGTPQAEMQSERGFTLIELVIGAAIAAVLTWTIVAMASRTIASAQALSARLDASAGSAHLIERLTSEAASALAVSAPSPHEIDFSAQDASHRTYAWSYTYNAATKTVARSTGEVIAPIDAFNASIVTADQVSNPASSAYDPLFANVNAANVTGNQLVALQITASGVETNVMLATPDAPTAFTVVVTYTPSPPPPATPTPVPPAMTP